MIPTRKSAAPQIALPWIVRMRYLMALWQIGRTVIVNRFLHVDLPLAWALMPPAVIILSNYWLSRRLPLAERHSRVSDSTLVAGMFVTDTLCFTASLMMTGGPDNPYNMLYLVNIALSATILRQSQTRVLGVLSCICYAFVFQFYRQLPALEIHPGGGSKLHLAGLWLAFAVATILVTVFSGKISELLHEREQSLLQMQEELSKKDRLASLVTLAAGAAHELSTPLATIAVVARELERYATQTVPNTAIALDSRLIRTEVDRCRRILRRMSIEGAEPAGEAMETLDAGALLSAVEESFSLPDRQRIRVGKPEGETVLMAPRHALVQALIALVGNAIEASPADRPVFLSALRSREAGSEGCVLFVVRDRGCGMSAESLRRAGEPFYTTKPPGKGMGLGIFLARTLATRLGGSLLLESPEMETTGAGTTGKGTTATLKLPQVHPNPIVDGIRMTETI